MVLDKPKDKTICACEIYEHKGRIYLDSLFYNMESAVFKREDLDTKKAIYFNETGLEFKSSELSENDKGLLLRLFFKNQDLANAANKDQMGITKSQQLKEKSLFLREKSDYILTYSKEFRKKLNKNI